MQSVKCGQESDTLIVTVLPSLIGSADLAARKALLRQPRFFLCSHRLDGPRTPNSQFGYAGSNPAGSATTMISNTSDKLQNTNRRILNE